MRYIKVNEIEPGMLLAVPLQDKDNRILLRDGRKITERIIDRILHLGIDGVYIEDELSKDISISSAISEKLKTKIISELRSKNVDMIVSSAKDMVNEIMKNTDCLNNLILVRDFDNYTYQHSISVGMLASMMGITCGFSQEDVENLTTAALLHDIGKTMIPLEILNKKEKLTHEERKIMDTHSVLGYKILREYDSVLSIVRVAVLEHHENFDGSGYPRALRDEKTHRFAKIIHIADVYDAMVSKRAYKDEIHPENAISFIMGESGRMFHPFYADIFMKCVPVYPKGVTVELSNGEKAIVTHNYPEYIFRPDIRTFDGRNISLMNDRQYLSVVITKTLL